MEQPPPIANDTPNSWDLVIADMQARDAVGRERYGLSLQPFNQRAQLTDSYHECLDMAVYLRTAMFEWDAIQARLDAAVEVILRARVVVKQMLDCAPSPNYPGSAWDTALAAGEEFMRDSKYSPPNGGDA